jgi:predicted RNA-binding protein with PUA-like domain
MSGRRFWLFKSEPDCYSYDDLAAEPSGQGPWDGVRNYTARNFMRDQMNVGDGILFYHSSCAEPHIAGFARVASSPYPDKTQFDPQSEYFDPKATVENPRWWLIDVAAERKLNAPLSLSRMRQMPELEGMLVLKKGNMLSITPVTEAEWQAIEREVSRS